MVDLISLEVLVEVLMELPQLEGMELQVAAVRKVLVEQAVVIIQVPSDKAVLVLMLTMVMLVLVAAAGMAVAVPIQILVVMMTLAEVAVVDM